MRIGPQNPNIKHVNFNDPFPPSRRDPLTFIDNTLIKIAGRSGRVLQMLTGQSHKELVRRIDLMGHYSQALSLVMLPLMDFEALQQHTGPSLKSPKQEELQCRTLGTSPYRPKMDRFTGFVTSVILSSAAFYGGTHILEKPDLIDPVSAAAIWFMGSMGMSISLQTFAKYLALSHIPRPPQRRILDKIQNGVKNLWEDFVSVPQPVPVPVPVPVGDKKPRR